MLMRFCQRGVNIFKCVWEWLRDNGQPIGTLTAVFGVFVAIRMPIAAADSKALADLVAARNLVYLAERLAEDVLDRVKSGVGDDKLSSPEFDFESSKKALESISFKEISPSSITQYFVDIWFVTLQAEKLRKDPTLFSKKYVAATLDRASCDMNTIDSFLDEIGVPRRDDKNSGKYGAFYYVERPSLWSLMFWRPIYFVPKDICSRGGVI